MFSEFDYEELFCGLFGISDEDRDADGFDLYDECHERLNVDFDAFCAVANFLISFTPVAESPLTKKHYHAFLKDGIAYMKKEASA